MSPGNPSPHLEQNEKPAGCPTTTQNLATAQLGSVLPSQA